MRVIYELPGELVNVLHVVHELRAITGMEPKAVVMDDGRRVKFQYGDYRLLLADDIDESTYIERNLIA